MSRRRRGRFVVLEGLDGAGTTTQAERLAEWLRRRSRRAHLTAEPSRGPVGALIRQVLSRRLSGGPGRAEFDPRALALLFAADRLDHVASEVDPKLAAGLDVISDRYALSSLAYQGLATGDAAWVAAVNASAPAPDVTILLEVDPVTAMRRRRAASGELEIFEVPAFQRRLVRAYRAGLARLRRSGQRVAVVDGDRSQDEVAAAVAAVVQGILERSALA